MKPKNLPKFRKETFNVAPDQGVVRMLSSMAPQGYRVHIINRKGTKAVVTYIHDDEEMAGGRG